MGSTIASVAAFVLPANLVDSVRTDPVPHRREWLCVLPGIVVDLAERGLGEPYQPGGRCAWVAPVRDVTGQDLVLKVAWRHDEAAHEADGLRAWAGQAAVRLHDSEVFDSTSVLLLERCHPGTTLAAALPEPEQDEVVAGLLRRLWAAPTDGCPFRPLQVMCNAWAVEFEEKLAASAGLLDPGLARAGIELFRPTYDALQHLLNCEERLVADPAGLAKRMADLLGLDPDRLISWLFARCIQESIDQPVLREVAARLAPG